MTAPCGSGKDSPASPVATRIPDFPAESGRWRLPRTAFATRWTTARVRKPDFSSTRNTIAAPYAASHGGGACWTFHAPGSFGLNAAAAGALEVESVDISAAALEVAAANARRNGLSDRIRYTEADAFDYPSVGGAWAARLPV